MTARCAFCGQSVRSIYTDMASVVETFRSTELGQAPKVPELLRTCLRELGKVRDVHRCVHQTGSATLTISPRSAEKSDALFWIVRASSPSPTTALVSCALYTPMHYTESSRQYGASQRDCQPPGQCVVLTVLTLASVVSHLTSCVSHLGCAAPLPLWEVQRLAKVCETSKGNRMVASPETFTGRASARILPQETASSGCAPESLPSNSCAVFMNTHSKHAF